MDSVQKPPDQDPPKPPPPPKKEIPPWRKKRSNRQKSNPDAIDLSQGAPAQQATSSTKEGPTRDRAVSQNQPDQSNTMDPQQNAAVQQLSSNQDEQSGNNQAANQDELMEPVQAIESQQNALDEQLPPKKRRRARRNQAASQNQPNQSDTMGAQKNAAVQQPSSNQEKQSGNNQQQSPNEEMIQEANPAPQEAKTSKSGRPLKAPCSLQREGYMSPGVDDEEVAPKKGAKQKIRKKKDEDPGFKIRKNYNRKAEKEPLRFPNALTLQSYTPNSSILSLAPTPSSQILSTSSAPIPSPGTEENATTTAVNLLVEKFYRTVEKKTLDPVELFSILSGRHVTSEDSEMIYYENKSKESSSSVDPSSTPANEPTTSTNNSDSTSFIAPSSSDKPSTTTPTDTTSSIASSTSSTSSPLNQTPAQPDDPSSPTHASLKLWFMEESAWRPRDSSPPPRYPLQSLLKPIGPYAYLLGFTSPFVSETHVIHPRPFSKDHTAKIEGVIAKIKTLENKPRGGRGTDEKLKKWLKEWEELIGFNSERERNRELLKMLRKNTSWDDDYIDSLLEPNFNHGPHGEEAQNLKRIEEAIKPSFELFQMNMAKFNEREEKWFLDVVKFMFDFMIEHGNYNIAQMFHLLLGAQPLKYKGEVLQWLWIQLYEAQLIRYHGPPSSLIHPQRKFTALENQVMEVLPEMVELLSMKDKLKTPEWYSEANCLLEKVQKRLWSEEDQETLSYMMLSQKLGLHHCEIVKVLKPTSAFHKNTPLPSAFYAAQLQEEFRKTGCIYPLLLTLAGQLKNEKKWVERVADMIIKMTNEQFKDHEDKLDFIQLFFNCFMLMDEATAEKIVDAVRAKLMSPAPTYPPAPNCPQVEANDQTDAPGPAPSTPQAEEDLKEVDAPIEKAKKKRSRSRRGKPNLPVSSDAMDMNIAPIHTPAPIAPRTDGTEADDVRGPAPSMPRVEEDLKEVDAPIEKAKKKRNRSRRGKPNLPTSSDAMDMPAQDEANSLEQTAKSPERPKTKRGRRNGGRKAEEPGSSNTEEVEEQPKRARRQRSRGQGGVEPAQTEKGTGEAADQQSEAAVSVAPKRGRTRNANAAPRRRDRAKAALDVQRAVEKIEPKQDDMELHCSSVAPVIAKIDVEDVSTTRSEPQLQIDLVQNKEEPPSSRSCTPSASLSGPLSSPCNTPSSSSSTPGPLHGHGIHSNATNCEHFLMKVLREIQDKGMDEKLVGEIKSHLGLVAGGEDVKNPEEAEQPIEETQRSQEGESLKPEEDLEDQDDVEQPAPLPDAFDNFGDLELNEEDNAQQDLEAESRAVMANADALDNVNFLNVEFFLNVENDAEFYRQIDAAENSGENVEDEDVGDGEEIGQGEAAEQLGQNQEEVVGVGNQQNVEDIGEDPVPELRKMLEATLEAALDDPVESQSSPTPSDSSSASDQQQSPSPEVDNVGDVPSKDEVKLMEPHTTEEVETNQCSSLQEHDCPEKDDPVVVEEQDVTGNVSSGNTQNELRTAEVMEPQILKKAEIQDQLCNKELIVSLQMINEAEIQDPAATRKSDQLPGTIPRDTTHPEAPSQVSTELLNSLCQDVPSALSPAVQEKQVSSTEEREFTAPSSPVITSDLMLPRTAPDFARDAKVCDDFGKRGQETLEDPLQTANRFSSKGSPTTEQHDSCYPTAEKVTTQEDCEIGGNASCENDQKMKNHSMADEKEEEEISNEMSPGAEDTEPYVMQNEQDQVEFLNGPVSTEVASLEDPKKSQLSLLTFEDSTPSGQLPSPDFKFAQNVPDTGEDPLSGINANQFSKLHEDVAAIFETGEQQDEDPNNAVSENLDHIENLTQENVEAGEVPTSSLNANQPAEFHPEEVMQNKASQPDETSQHVPMKFLNSPSYQYLNVVIPSTSGIVEPQIIEEAGIEDRFSNELDESEEKNQDKMKPQSPLLSSKCSPLLDPQQSSSSEADDAADVPNAGPVSPVPCGIVSAENHELDEKDLTQRDEEAAEVPTSSLNANRPAEFLLEEVIKASPLDETSQQVPVESLHSPNHQTSNLTIPSIAEDMEPQIVEEVTIQDGQVVAEVIMKSQSPLLSSEFSSLAYPQQPSYSEADVATEVSNAGSVPPFPCDHSRENHQEETIVNVENHGLGEKLEDNDVQETDPSDEAPSQKTKEFESPKTTSVPMELLNSPSPQASNLTNPSLTENMEPQIMEEAAIQDEPDVTEDLMKIQSPLPSLESPSLFDHQQLLSAEVEAALENAGEVPPTPCGAKQWTELHQEEMNATDSKSDEQLEVNEVEEAKSEFPKSTPIDSPSPNPEPTGLESNDEKTEGSSEDLCSIGNLERTVDPSQVQKMTSEDQFTQPDASPQVSQMKLSNSSRPFDLSAAKEEQEPVTEEKEVVDISSSETSSNEPSSQAAEAMGPEIMEQVEDEDQLEDESEGSVESDLSGEASSDSEDDDDGKGNNYESDEDEEEEENNGKDVNDGTDEDDEQEDDGGIDDDMPRTAGILDSDVKRQSQERFESYRKRAFQSSPEVPHSSAKMLRFDGNDGSLKRKAIDETADVDEKRRMLSERLPLETTEHDVDAPESEIQFKLSSSEQQQMMLREKQDEPSVPETREYQDDEQSLKPLYVMPELQYNEDVGEDAHQYVDLEEDGEDKQQKVFTPQVLLSENPQVLIDQLQSMEAGPVAEEDQMNVMQEFESIENVDAQPGDDSERDVEDKQQSNLQVIPENYQDELQNLENPKPAIEDEQHIELEESQPAMVQQQNAVQQQGVVHQYPEEKLEQPKAEPVAQELEMQRIAKPQPMDEEDAQSNEEQDRAHQELQEQPEPAVKEIPEEPLPIHFKNYLEKAFQYGITVQNLVDVKEITNQNEFKRVTSLRTEHERPNWLANHKMLRLLKQVRSHAKWSTAMKDRLIKDANEAGKKWRDQVRLFKWALKTNGEKEKVDEGHEKNLYIRILNYVAVLIEKGDETFTRDKLLSLLLSTAQKQILHRQQFQFRGLQLISKMLRELLPQE